MNTMSSEISTGIDWAKIREDFTILNRMVNRRPLVYLDNAASSQKPQQVIDAIAWYYEHYNSNVHRGVHTLSQEATEAFEVARDKVKRFINAAHKEEIIFTRGTTDSINTVSSTFDGFISEGHEVLISGLEHHSNIVPWQMLCERRKAKLRVIPISDSGEWILDDLDSLVNEKTKIVAINHISNVLGTVNPVEKVIEKAHSLDIPVLIDGAQSVPHCKVDVQKLDCEFFCFSGHKMLAATGVGILYGKKDWLEKLPPYQGGGDMIKEVTFEKTTYNELPFKFEAGTPNIEGAVSISAAIDYLETIGMENIAAREEELRILATEKLSLIEGLKIYGTAACKAAVVSFLIDGTHPYDVGVLLDKQGIAVRTGHHCAQPLMQRFNIPGTIRASFAFYNNEADVERLVEGVKKAVGMLR